MDNIQVHEVSVVTEEGLKDKIYFIRGQKVMLDVDLAEIYGYETKNFNRQVKNNAERFAGEEFMFQLTKEDMAELSRCKNFTLNNGGGRGSNIKYLPYAFTEQGIYMLMIVLKGELAVKQSRALVTLFKEMKDYLIDSPGLIGQEDIARLTVQNSVQIAELNTKVSRMEASMATKDDLSGFMMNFMDNHIGKELLFMDGETVESDVAYAKIYGQAKKTIYILDNYIGIKSLLLLKDIGKNVKVTVFTDNLGKRLTLAEYQDFCKEYPTIKVDFQKTMDKFHDRFVVLDFGAKTQKIYHCGGSSKDSGTRTMVISRMENESLFAPMVQGLLKNPALVLNPDKTL